MPDINIHGTPPGQGPRKPSTNPETYTGTVSDNLRREADFEAAMKARRDQKRERENDYDRAHRQKERQDNAQAQAEARRRRQEDRMEQQRQSEERRRQRAVDRQTTQEAREHERQRREEQRRQQAQQRQHDRDARLQAQLERRQATERDQRLRSETLIRRHFENLQNRAGATLSPATYRAIGRAAHNLNYRLDDFGLRHGGASPFGASRAGVASMLEGMGSFANTYTTQNIARLGGLGQRAADTRDFRELVRIEHELRRIEKINEKQLRSTDGLSKLERINAERNLNAVREARTRIAAGRAGMSPMMNMAGTAMGLGSMLLRNPYVDLAVGAGTAFFTAPMIAAGISSKLTNASRPYMNLRRGFARLGRAGNYSSLAEQGLVYNGGVPPAWMMRLGITPQDYLAIRNQYGITATSPQQGREIVSDIAHARLMSGMGLSNQQLAGYGNVLAQLGIVQPGGATTGLAHQYSKLQKVMEFATAQGLDHSTMIRTMATVMQTNAQAGAVGVNQSSTAKFIAQMAGSGIPGLRSTAGIAQAAAGFNSAMGNIGLGGSVSGNLMMMTQKGGLPKTKEGMRKFLGMSKLDFDKMMAEPGMQEMWKDYVSSPNPAFANTFLSYMVKGHPEIGLRLFQNSMFGRGLHGAAATVAAANVTGLGIPAIEAEKAYGQSGFRSTILNNNPLNLRFAGQGTAIGRDYRGFAKFSTMEGGIAAEYRQLLKYESRGLTTPREIVKKWAPRAPASYIRDVAAAVGVSPDTPVDLSDPKIAAKFMHAMAAHEVGSKYANNIVAPHIAGGIALAMNRSGPKFGNTPTGVYAVESHNAALGLAGSQQVYQNAALPAAQNIGNAVGEFSNFVMRATSSLEQFIGSLTHASAVLNGMNSAAASNMHSNPNAFPTPGSGQPLVHMPFKLPYSWLQPQRP